MRNKWVDFYVTLNESDVKNIVKWEAQEKRHQTKADDDRGGSF